MRWAEFAGGPHPGRHHRPTLPQKRLGEGWAGGWFGAGGGDRRASELRGADESAAQTAGSPDTGRWRVRFGASTAFWASRLVCGRSPRRRTSCVSRRGFNPRHGAIRAPFGASTASNGAVRAVPAARVEVSLSPAERGRGPGRGGLSSRTEPSGSSLVVVPPSPRFCFGREGSGEGPGEGPRETSDAINFPAPHDSGVCSLSHIRSWERIVVRSTRGEGSQPRTRTHIGPRGCGRPECARTPPIIPSRRRSSRDPAPGTGAVPVSSPAVFWRMFGGAAGLRGAQVGGAGHLRPSTERERTKGSA
ncbi:hypothetical protein FHS01_004266 [Longimicrobium terrae]|uniref:Uncharacterized protein n=1 Tax=Longimicrobium terrae TaxID=1639882 RepID=A0A841H5V7_9BACT|nr:hypothetical protein [Longimicrobium terrae]MBB6073635.1 hypothetical protein [Longimicrobium terrae]